MSYEQGQSTIVAYKAQSGLGSPASGAGGKGLRIAKGSQGLRLMKQIIENEESRRDGQSSRGRHGTKSATGSYQAQLCVGELDDLFAALLRSTWTAQVNISFATVTSITTTTNTIVAAGGSWITQGVRRGDLVQLTNHSTAANNGKWFRVLSVTASTITLPANSLTADAAPDSAGTLTIAKTLVSAAAPTEIYYTWDELSATLDQSLVATDAKVCRIEVVADPNKSVMCTVSFMGLDVQSVTGASAPSLTSPTFQITRPLVLADGKISINGVDYADLTSFRFVYDLGGVAPGVLAPNAPDVFLNNAKLTGSVSGLRKDNAQFNFYRNETQLEFFAHCLLGTDADPKSFHSFYVGDATYNGNDFSVGSEGPITDVLPFTAGKDEGGSDRAATMIKMSSSAP